MGFAIPRVDGPGVDGFTLIELVVTLAVTAVISGLLIAFIVRPMTGFQDVAVRAALVDAADVALTRLARDVRVALPNSIRVSADARSLEILHTSDGARYRNGPGTNAGGADHSASAAWLDFAGDTGFNVLGRLSHLSFVYGSPLPAGQRLAIHPTTAGVYVDAATGANPGVITPAATTLSITGDGDEDQLVLSSAFRFRYTSPGRRLYVVDGPVSFVCDLAGGTLVRFASYAIASAQPTVPSIPPLASAVRATLASRVTRCRFGYDAGTATRAALVTLELGLASGGEQVRLLRQVHVENLP